MNDWASIKEEIIETEERFHQEGLLIRMGGSISCRIDEESFYYAGGEFRHGPWNPEEVRRVKLHRAQSDNAVHAAIYRARKDVNAIALTRQCFGSALGVLHQDGLYAEDARGKRLKIRVVPFTVPGSDAQRSHVRRLAAKDKEAPFLILANHGVFSFGEDLAVSFQAAKALEGFGEAYLAEVGSTRLPCHVVHGFDSIKEGEEGRIRFMGGEPPARVKQIHEELYARFPEARAIVHNKSEAAATLSRLRTPLFILYDDMVRLRLPDRCLFVYDDGAYCLGEDEEQAALAALSVEKACIAQIAGARMDGAHVISRRDVRRLRK